jgi:DNA repair exonuclease SbcCD ATPase subunit
MAEDVRTQMRRPLPLALAALAVIGWIAVIWLATSRASIERDLTEQVQQTEAERDETAADLAELGAATGTLTEIEARIETENTTLADLEAQRQNAQEAHEGEMARLADQIEAEQLRFELAQSRGAALDEAGRGKVRAAEARLADLQGDVAESSTALRELRGQALEDAHRLMVQQAELGLAQQRTEAQSRQLVTLGERLQTARGQSAQAQQTLAELSQEAAGLSRELADAERRIQEARVAEAELQEQMTTARAEFSRMQTQRDELEQAVEDLQARREQLAADTAAAEEQRARVQQQVTELATSLSSRSNELATLEQRITELQAQGAERAEAEAQADVEAVPEPAPIAPGEYTSGAVTASFGPDGSFTMENSERSQSVQGRYAVETGVLTLSDAEGDIGRVQFPLQCGVEAAGNGFRLSAHEGGCANLDGTVFEPTQQ